MFAINDRNNVEIVALVHFLFQQVKRISFVCEISPDLSCDCKKYLGSSLLLEEEIFISH